ncbi:MAG: TonB-dependent receptor domain-containing protein [Thermoanaerobaculia bacterium]
MKRLAVALALGLLLPGTVFGSIELDYAGRPLAQALDDLRERGLRLVYGSNVVKPWMIVSSDPEVDTLRHALDALLAPHGLAARESSAGIVTVIPAPHGTVVGEVHDIESGEGVPGAEVEIPGLRAVRTDREGRFEIKRVPPGDQELEARKAGYVVEQRSVEVSSGHRARVVFRLNPVEDTLEEMVVTPGRMSLLHDAPAAGLLWSREEVSRLPHLSDDVYRAVSRLPGIASGDFSADFHVRGGERNETLVLVDGLRVYEPYHLKDFQNVFSIFDSRAIGAIEVMSGGFTAEYGDRMSGVIDISSVVPLEPRTMVGVSFEKVHLMRQGRFDGGNGEWLVNARHGYLDLLLDAVSTDENDFDLSPAYYDLFGKVRRPWGHGGLLSLSVLAAADETEFVSVDDDDDLTSSYDSGYVWVRLDSVVSGRVSQTSVLSYGRLESERDGESGSNQSDPFLGSDRGSDRTRVSDDRSTEIVQLRQDWRFDPSDRHHLRSGFELRRLDSSYDYTFVNLVTDPVFTDEELMTRRRFDLTRSGSTYGAYLADRFRLAPRVTIEAGVRWDRQTHVDEDQLSPRLNVVAQLGADTTLRASWGRYSQSQDIHELQIVDGVDEFHPAQLNEQTTIALDRRLGRRSRLAVQLYSKRLEHPRPRFENLFEPIDIFPEGQSDRVLIAPELGRSRGLETLFERGGKRFDWWLSYTLSKTEDRIDGTYVPRSWDQRHALSYSVNLELNERWNLNLAGIHHSGWPATDASLVSVPGQVVPSIVPRERNSGNYPTYHRIDVRASRRIDRVRGELELFLEVTNLLDRNNLRSISDFEISFAPETGFAIEREFEKWFPRLPSFGVSWTF